MTTNHNESGLFDNPYLDEQLDQDKQTTLEQIKDDTSAIREAIYQFGGDALKQAKAFEKYAVSQQKQSEIKELSEAIQKGVVLDPALTASLKQAVKNTEKNAKATVSSPTQMEVSPPSPNKAAKKVNTTPIPLASSKDKEAVKPIEKLPNGWQRDKNGRVRDLTGRYVAERTLKKHHIQNPPQKAQKENDTTSDARERRVLDALKNIKDEIGEVENIDPMVNAIQELGQPLKALIGVGQVSSEIVGRGLGKIFNRQTQSEKANHRWFSFFRKSTKEQTKREIKTNDWLQRIFKKNENGGIFGKLLMALLAIPTSILAVLKRFFDRLFAAKLAKSVAEGLSGGGARNQHPGKTGGRFSKLGKLGKFFKRVPLLGTALSLFEIGSAMGDDSIDEKGQSNKAKGIGAGIGALAGGLIGSFLGPVGSIAGAIIGDIVGEKIGGWLSTVNWAEIAKDLKQIWQSAAQWISDSWDNTVVPAWQKTTKWIDESWTEIKGFFKSLVPDWLKEGASGAITKTKEIGQNLIQTGKEYITNAQNYVTDKFQNVTSWFSETTTNIASFFSREEEKTTNTDSIFSENNTHLKQANTHHEEIESNTDLNVEAQNKTNTLLEQGHSLVKEGVEWLKTNLLPSQGYSDEYGNTYADSDDNLYSDSAGLDEQGQPVAHHSKSSSPNYAYSGQKTIANFTQKETEGYLNTVIAKESGGKLNAKNSYGYLGLYQMGAAALVDAGYINAEKYQQAVKQYGKGLSNGSNATVHDGFLANPANWTIEGGREAFLGSKALQDDAMIRMTQKNARTLSQNGVFAGDKSHQFGALHAAHLAGAGAASQYLKKGKDKVDGYGTSASSRYRYGKQQFAKLNLASQVATPVSTTQHTKEPTTSPLDISKVSEKHIEIPAVHVEKTEDYQSLSKTIEQQAVKNTEKNAKTSTIIATNSVDPIFQFLTQDVSERRIAHIVTGGLLRTERI